MSRPALRQLLTAQSERWWNIHIQRFRSKQQFLRYAGRYARRPPIAQHPFRTIGPSSNMLYDEGHPHETAGRDHVHASGVPGHLGRSHPRPLSPHHSVFRSPRASREIPDPRCDLRAPAAGTTKEASTTAVGHIAVKADRHRPDSAYKRQKSAAGWVCQHAEELIRSNA